MQTPAAVPPNGNSHPPPLATVTRPPIADDGGSRSQHAAFGVLAAILVLLGLFTLRHFLDALAWAVIFAIALWPLYRRTETRLGMRHDLRLALLFTAAVALLFIVPMILVGVQLVREAHAAAGFLRDAAQHGIPEPDALHHLPAGQGQVDGWWGRNLADATSARQLVERLGKGGAGNLGRIVGAQVAHRLTSFVFTLVALFFLFRDGDRLTRQLTIAAARAFGPGGERVGLQIIASVHGTVNGLVGVGLAEGAVIGVLYAVAGVPHPTAFGALTAVAAMVPGGALVVITLAAAVTLASASMAAAAIVWVAGGAIVFAADHFARPALIGRTTKLPFLWVLLGILGGLEMWGLIGLFVGPAIMSALILLWREWTGDAVHPA